MTRQARPAQDPRRLGRMGRIGGTAAGRGGRGSGLVSGVAGRARGLGDGRGSIFEALENRALLNGDHPGLPNPFVPGQGTLLTVDTAAALTSQQRGRAVAAGLIASGDPGDLFRFVMPAVSGRPNDLVTVFVDGILGTNNTTLYASPQLDSTVTIYDGTGNVIASGTNNGLLTSSANPVPDAWASFIGVPGQTYYVLVQGQGTGIAAGRAGTGNYTVRVDATTVDAPPDGTGVTNPTGNIAFLNDENVFRVVNGAGAAFSSLATVSAIAPDGGTLDTHASVYTNPGANTQAGLLFADSDSGRLTNAYGAFKDEPSTTYFVRVRSDRTTGTNAVGAFTAQIDTLVAGVTISPVTRLGSAVGIATGPAGLPAGTGTASFGFTSQGTGLGVVTIQNIDLFPVDMAVRVYDSTGALIGFNDNYRNINPEIRVPILGNRQYFVVVDSFNDPADGSFVLTVEAHHTFDPVIGVDDHVNAPATGATVQEQERIFGQATPLRFGPTQNNALTPTQTAPPNGSRVQVAAGSGRIQSDLDTDLFSFVPPLTQRGNFPGRAVSPATIPPRWEPGEQPSSRLEVVLSPAVGEPFLTPLLRIYDSNLTLVYPRSATAPFNTTFNGKVWNQARNPQALDFNAGSYDTASYRPGAVPAETQGIPVWGGEIYYIEIGGFNTGRYSLTVQVDGVGTLVGSGGGAATYADGIVTPPPGLVHSLYIEPLNAGGYSSAILLGPNNETGQARIGVDSRIAYPNTPGWYIRDFADTAPNMTDGGTDVLDFVGLPSIETPGDTDLFRFRAPATGTMEFRIVTRGIINTYSNVRITAPLDPLTQPPTIAQDSESKTYNSPLSSALRVFNNDFQQLAFSAGQFTVSGSTTGDTYDARFGLDDIDPDQRTFTARDARIVIPVTAGTTYFVQVESAFAALFASNPDLIDYGHATGSYELIVNATPSPNTIDDFENGDAREITGTALSVDELTGIASRINGTIRDVTSGPILNPVDTDAFRYVAPARGQVSISVQAVSPGLRPSVLVFDGSGALIASNTGTLGGTATLNINSIKGDRLYIVVDGSDDTQGDYTLDVAGPRPLNTDSQAGFWGNATGLTINRFLGQYNATGRLQFAGDTDLFSFTAENYELATVTITGTSDNFNPLVRVYEIGDDGASNPVYLQIAFNDDLSGADRSARATFSVTPGRRYYVEVEGTASGNGNTLGSYNLSVQVLATDDHPNRSDYTTASNIPLVLDPLSFSSSGLVTGQIEIAADNDFFRFSTVVSGRATITIAAPSGSTLAPTLLILDAGNNPLPGVTYTIGPATAIAEIPSVGVNTTYYVVVQPVAVPPVGQTSTGTYSVSVATSPIDDYANFGDPLSAAALIALSTTTGIGTRTGVIVPSGDSDLFRFVTLAAGTTQLRITTAGSDLNPRLRLLNSSGAIIATSLGNGDSAAFALTATGAGETYYIVVDATPGATGGFAVGNYLVTVVGALPGGGGPGPGPGGPDDHANAGEYNDASIIPIDGRSGFGSATGIINTVGDTDLFVFRAPASGPVDLQVNIPAGGQLDARVRVYNSARVLIFEDAGGIPGSTASVQFSVLANTDYFVLVEPIGPAVGSYVVRVQTQPQSYFLFFPEGYASPNIDQFVPIVNDNDGPVEYSIYARYETGDQRLTPIATGTIAARSRGGVTITSRSQPASASLVDFNRPYALEIFSTRQVSANLSHYDFGASVGEAFTNVASQTWSFAEAHRDRSIYRDFLLFYNPAEAGTATVTISLFYTNGQVTTFTQNLEGRRRGGVNFDQDTRLTADGTFGILVTSTIPIVSSLTSFNLVTSGGEGVLGDSTGGAVRGAVSQGVQTSSGINSNLALLNTNETAVNVTITANYGRVDLPNLVRTITIPARTAFAQSLEAFGLLNAQTAGITYVSSAPVTFQVTQYQQGDGDAATTATSAAKAWYFADLFINPVSAGTTYREQLGVYNPSGVAAPVTLTFFFADGSASLSRTINVPANGFNFYQLDQDPFILARTGATAYSLRVSSSTSIVAAATHYDLFLNGGWSTLGAPIGLLNPLSTI